MATMQIDVMIPETVADGAAVLNEKDVAAMLNLSRDTVRAMQLSHDGPEYVQLPDGRVRYSIEAVQAWQAQRAAAHKALMASYGGGCVEKTPDAQRIQQAPLPGATLRFLAGQKRPHIAVIGNGLYCRMGKPRTGCAR